MRKTFIPRNEVEVAASNYETDLYNTARKRVSQPDSPWELMTVSPDASFYQSGPNRDQFVDSGGIEGYTGRAASRTDPSFSNYLLDQAAKEKVRKYKER